MAGRALAALAAMTRHGARAAQHDAAVTLRRMAKETTRRAGRRRRIFWALAILALALPCCGVLAFFAYLWPGGVRPTYHAVDHDLFLTLHARSAKPVIDAVERHRRENGTYPASMTSADGWVYTPSRDGYVLRKNDAPVVDTAHHRPEGR